MDLEYFWAVICWAVVVGGALLALAVLRYWFAASAQQADARRSTAARTQRERAAR